MTPSAEDNERARSWLEQWVPGYSLGQWAALAELLASQSPAPPAAAAAAEKGMHLFARVMPGHDLHDSEMRVWAVSREHALELAGREARGVAGGARYIGFLRDPTSARMSRLETSLDYEGLPPSSGPGSTAR